MPKFTSFDFICECGEAKSALVEAGEKVFCACGKEMKKAPVATKSYKMRGNNDASTTPAKFTGGRRSYD